MEGKDDVIHKDNTEEQEVKNEIQDRPQECRSDAENYDLTQGSKAIDISKKPRSSHKLTVTFQSPISICFLHDAWGGGVRTRMI
jgi:hypothetical protein